MSTTEVATTLSPEALADYLRERLGERLQETTVAHGQLVAHVDPAALPDVAQLCKGDPNLGFDFFDFLAGVDEREDGFGVIVHLYSHRHRHHITLRALAPGGRENPRVPTLTGVYRGANWHERETYDMFGIEFEGHPRLLPRILTIENFEGFPLRKEFLLSTREAKPWPGEKEPVEHDDEAAEADVGAAPAAADEDPARPAHEADKAAAAKARAERARAKAAEMRAKKARERAAEGQPAGGDPVERAAEVTDSDAEAAAQMAVGAGDPDAATPEGAAEVADSAVAKDAAAGSVGGDVEAGAPGDEPGVDEPVTDAAAEEAMGEGAPPVPSGTPGVEAEGRHTGAREQEGEKPAAETPGMGEAGAERPSVGGDQHDAEPESDEPDEDEGQP